MSIVLESPYYLLILLLIPLVLAMLRRAYGRKGLRGYPLAAGLFRSLTILALALALSDPKLEQPDDDVNLFYCLDVSASIVPERESEVQRFMETSMHGMQPGDRAGFIVFARTPSVEKPLARDLRPLPYRSVVDRDWTDIHAALNLAVGRLPRSGKNRIVLFTDGNETMGSALEMANVARALDIEIFPVALTPGPEGMEIRVEDLQSPPDVSLDSPFEVRVVISSSRKTEGELVLQRNDDLLFNRSVSLKPGKNVIPFRDNLRESGLYRYRAVLNAAGDRFYENNEGLSFTRALRRPSILYVRADSGASSPPADALEAQGLKVVRVDPDRLPVSVAGLIDHNAVVLDNVSGDLLTYGAMEAIEEYVRDLGGGLVMIGGDKGFGAGNYLGTPVEKALPVFMDVPTDAQISGVCIVMVIDKSESMIGYVEGKSKLDMAKIAAFSTVELLNPIDKVGIVAFDTGFQWVVPITRAGDRGAIARQLSALQEEGGTDLFPALVDTLRVLKGQPAVKKHVIVLSDGQTLAADFDSLIESFREASITVSTVAVGSSADLQLMQQIAERGGGRWYYAASPDHIPRIFTDETRIVVKDLIVEQRMIPRLRTPSELLNGIASHPPPVYGQVLTYPKPGAEVVFDTPEGPLLVTGRYGLGRSLAFTSDLAGRWGMDWTGWEYYARFVSQMVKWTQKSGTPRRYAASTRVREGNGIFTVDVTDERNRYVNHLDLKARVLMPDRSSREVSLDQILPGRYRGAFPVETTGEYYLSLVETEATGPAASRSFGFGIAYTDEFAAPGTNHALLERLARITEAKVLDIGSPPDDLFSPESGGTGAGLSLWPYLTVGFIILLFGDVLLRKWARVKSIV